MENSQPETNCFYTNSILEGKKYNIGIEIGGTNIKAAIISSEYKPEEIINLIRDKKVSIGEFKTNLEDIEPEDTIREVTSWVLVDNKIESRLINRVLVSMFGPLNLQKLSDDYGQVLNTPKKGWRSFNVVKSLAKNLGIEKNQILIELDVNCAAYMEYKLGNHK